MLMYRFFVTLYFLFNSVIAAEPQKYDVIIIPVPRHKPKNLNVLSSIKRPRKRNQYLRLDLTHLHQNRALPEVENLDFTLRAENTNGSRHFSDSMSYDSDLYGDDKIVGGAEVDINLYPYHVAYGSNCGGAIIDKKWVITAGHCGRKPYIRVGSKYLNEGKKVNVKKTVVHPNWSARSKEHPFDFDFQLLELEEPLKFDDNIQPVKIGHVEDMVIGKVISVTGWGNTVENGPYSNVLRAVRVPIISKENCQQVPFPYFRGSLTPRMFCAGYKEGKKDACQGDSGGPAVAYDRLLGIISFGYGCATPGSFGVYSKVAKVRGWIEETTGLRLS